MRRALTGHYRPCIYRVSPPLRSASATLAFICECGGERSRHLSAAVRRVSTASEAAAARAQRVDKQAKIKVEDASQKPKLFWKTKAAVALFGTMCLVPGPYARWSADTDKSQPSETEGGALRRIAEDSGAEGEGAPLYCNPFGHSVPTRAKQRCDTVGFDFSNNPGIRWGMFCCDAYCT
jgi:hypothetical protein